MENHIHIVVESKSYVDMSRIFSTLITYEPEAFICPEIFTNNSCAPTMTKKGIGGWLSTTHSVSYTFTVPE
jgi:hypothetical protein